MKVLLGESKIENKSLCKYFDCVYLKVDILLHLGYQRKIVKDRWLLPMQFLGPAPKGIKAQGCLFCTRSGKNLQQNSGSFEIFTNTQS